MKLKKRLLIQVVQSWYEKVGQKEKIYASSKQHIFGTLHIYIFLIPLNTDFFPFYLQRKNNNTFLCRILIRLPSLPRIGWIKWIFTFLFLGADFSSPGITFISFECLHTADVRNACAYCSRYMMIIVCSFFLLLFNSLILFVTTASYRPLSFCVSLFLTSVQGTILIHERSKAYGQHSTKATLLYDEWMHDTERWKYKTEKILVELFLALWWIKVLLVILI